MKDQRGFSLVELLVVVAIMGVLAAIAIPTLMTTTFPHMKIKKSSMEIYTALQLSRSKAIGSTQQYGVEFNLDATPVTYRIMTRANALAVWAADGSFATKEIDTAVIVKKVTVDGTEYTTGTTGVIRFESVGTASSAAIDLESLNDSADQYSILVNGNTGRVQIQ